MVIFRRIGIFSFFLPIIIFRYTRNFQTAKHKFSIKSKILFGVIKIMLTFAIENNKYTKQWELTFTKKSPATRDASGKDAHLTIMLPTFWQVHTHMTCIVNLWTNMVAYLPQSGITGISILRGCRTNPASVNFQAINFQIMKAKIITIICALIGALALFVFLPAEAPTGELQILWSGSWLFVFWLCAKGIDKYGEDEQ